MSKQWDWTAFPSRQGVVNLAVRVPPELREAAQELAKERGVTVQQMIRQLLEEEVEKRGAA